MDVPWGKTIKLEANVEQLKQYIIQFLIEKS